MTHEQSTAPATPPGAGLLAVLASAWLLAMFSSARHAIGDSPDDSPLTVTRAALELPQVISASLLAGIAVGLAVLGLLTRWWPGRLAGRGTRLVAGAGAGAVTGLAVAAPILLGYGGLPSILVLSGAAAITATCGGLLSGVREPAVVAAGAAGTLAVFAIGLIERAFEGDLRRLFGAGQSADSVLSASGWAALSASLTAGAVAGLLAFGYLRRYGRPGLRWPGYLLAGTLPGLLVLAAEAVTRLAGARLFQLVSAASADDQAVLSYFSAARFNRASVVLFVGGLVAIGLLGRTLRPAEPELREPSPPEPEPGEPKPEPAEPETGGRERSGR